MVKNVKMFVVLCMFALLQTQLLSAATREGTEVVPVQILRTIQLENAALRAIQLEDAAFKNWAQEHIAIAALKSKNDGHEIARLRQHCEQGDAEYNKLFRSLRKKEKNEYRLRRRNKELTEELQEVASRHHDTSQDLKEPNLKRAADSDAAPEAKRKK